MSHERQDLGSLRNDRRVACSSQKDPSSPYLVNFESLNEGYNPIFMDTDPGAKVEYNSLKKSAHSLNKQTLTPQFFINPKNLNSPSFFLKKAQIILQKKGNRIQTLFRNQEMDILGSVKFPGKVALTRMPKDRPPDCCRPRARTPRS